MAESESLSRFDGWAGLDEEHEARYMQTSSKDTHYFKGGITASINNKLPLSIEKVDLRTRAAAILSRKG